MVEESTRRKWARLNYFPFFRGGFRCCSDNIRNVFNNRCWVPAYDSGNGVQRIRFKSLSTLCHIWAYCRYWTFTSRNIRKRTFGYVRPAKIQISLRIRAVWSTSSLGAFWIANDATFLHASTKTQFRLRRCAGRFVSSLGAHVRR